MSSTDHGMAITETPGECLGQNIHVIATIDDFNKTQELLHLSPVGTRIR